VLCHLASFRGGCDVESAEAVCGGGVHALGGVRDVLIRLADRSLVTTVDDAEPMRYRLHETIREFALSSVGETDREAIRERHARWFALLAERLYAGPPPGGDRAWIRRHDVERDNFRAAAERLRVHDPATALRLLVMVEPGMDLTAQWMWCVDLIRDVLPMAGDAPASVRAGALAMLAWVDDDRDAQRATEECAAALDLLPDVDDPAVDCWVLATWAKCHAEAGGELDEDQIAAAVDAGDRAGGTYSPIMVRYVLSFRAHPPIAERLCTDALNLAERLDLDLFVGLVRASLATIAQFRGDGPAALAMWRQPSPLLDEVTLAEGDNACFYALAEGEHNDVAVGLHIAEHYIARVTSSPHDPAAVAALYSAFAHLRRLAGDVDGAELALEISRRHAEPTVDFLGVLTHVTRSALWRARGEPHLAAAALAERADHRDVGFRGLTDIPMRVMEELAAVALALGRVDDCADLLATAREARLRDGKPLSPPAGGTSMSCRWRSANVRAPRSARRRWHR
jgi:hypothetical protein